MPKRRNQLARRLVALAARSQTAMNDFLEMIAAWKFAHILAVHRARHVAAQQHRGEESDLINVVSLLPAADLAPRDLVRDVKQIEIVGGDATPAELMRGDAEIAELELLPFA